MKRLAFAFFLTINLSLGFSQNQRRIDNLTHELIIAKQDTHRVSIMVNLSNSYLYIRIDSAVIYGENAVALARKLNSPKSEAISLSQLGFVYRESGDLTKALTLTNKALKFFEEKEDWQKLANCKNSLGLIYWDLKEFGKALQYYHQAKLIFERLKLIRRVAGVQNNIGIVFTEMNQLDSAKIYLTQSYESNIQSGANGLVPLRNLGSVQEKMGNHRLALDIYAKCWRINDSSDVRNTSLLNIITAESYQSISKPDSAIFYAIKGLKLAKRGPYRKRIVEAYSILKEAYKSKGDFKLALENEELMMAERDSLYGTSIRSVVSQEEENQIEIENNKKEYKNQLKQYAFLAGLIILLLVALILYRNNQKEKKAKNLIQEQKEKVESTLSQLKSTQTQLIQSEKLASLGELTAGIAHEIQNPLNFVNNFSELSIDLAKELKEEAEKPEIDRDLIIDLATDLSQNQEKINLHGKRASSIVKGMLEHSKPSTGIKELTDINALADEYLRLAYHGMMAKDKNFKAEFSTDFTKDLPKIEVIPQDFGRVLLNLINNAFYAVKNVENPLVELKTEIRDNQMLIKVKDNGIGMNETTKAKVFQPFFTTKPTGEGTGLGLSLAYDIITKGHGGTLDLESTEGLGSVFIISLPFKTT